MGNANETYSAIFDLFTYWGYSMEAEPGKTLGEILQDGIIQKLTLVSLNYQMEINMLHTGVLMMVDGLIMDRA